MRIYTGNEELDSILERKDGFIIVYGEPGSGKTNLIAKILRECASRGVETIYISTEGSVNVYRVVEVVGGFEDRILISSVYSLSELLLALLRSIELMRGVIAIDSINYLYRIEGGYSYRSNEVFLSILGLIRYVSRTRGIKFLASAQIREVEGVTELSGRDLIEFFKPYMIRSRKISYNLFELYLEDEDRRFRYSLKEGDLIWIR
ncbi:MAG: AAA family ATPase [Sulfolobales archaeon]